MRTNLKVLLATLATGLLPAGPAMAGSTIRSEPMVIYDLSGHGIGGAVHQHLSVYNSGLCSLSSLSVSGMLVDSTPLPVWKVRALVKTLIDFGALDQEDLPLAGADLPMSTVSVFDPSFGGSRVNSFSFYVADDPQVALISAILDGFIFETFDQPKALVESGREEAPLQAWRERMRYSQRIEMPAIELGIEFVDVPSDSRCPTDVECPWPGEAEIVLNVWYRREDLGEVHLTYGAETGSFAAVAGEFEIRVLGVRPAPRADRTIRLDDYAILLQISEI